MFILCTGCPSTGHQNQYEATLQELEATKNALTKAQTALDSVINQPNSLVHLVLFKIKDDLPIEEKNTLIKDLKNLQDLEGVKNISVGEFQDLADPRAMSDYQIALQMSFESEENYIYYQKHEIHLKLKEGLGAYLAGPPMTYDYWEK